MAVQTGVIDQPKPTEKLLGLPRERGFQLIVLVVGLILWELVGMRVGKFILAPPSALVKAFFEMLGSGELLHALMDSITGLLIGFVIALVTGVVLGFLMGWYRPF